MLRVGYAITLTIVWPFLLSDSAIAETGPSESVRFLVGELHPHHYDSYVLPLGDPAAIAHARELITDPSAAGQAIVVAKVAHGRDGINRNYVAPGAFLVLACSRVHSVRGHYGRDSRRLARNVREL